MLFASSAPRRTRTYNPLIKSQRIQIRATVPCLPSGACAYSGNSGARPNPLMNYQRVLLSYGNGG